jgi:Sulfotransferase domain
MPMQARAKADTVVARLAAPLPWLTRSRRTAVRGWHRVSNRGRALPDFVVIGAQKSGTTSLYRYLAAHPGIVGADTKEVHYFDVNYRRGVDWYRSNFPPRRRLERLTSRLGRQGLTGEATPYYLFHPHVPQRMHALLPDAKLIVLLRDPVDRAISHHNHECQDGYETLPFAEAIEIEAHRLPQSPDLLAADDAAPAVFSHRHHSYLSRGRYAEQLEAWFALYPRDRFLIMESGELFDDPPAAVARTLSFLGLPPHELASYENVTSRPKSDIEPDLRRRLYAYFAPHNQRLYELLGTNFRWEDRAP